MLNSPLRWAGGKSRLRKSIIPLIPPKHQLYVEPFAGAAWVLFGKSPSPQEVLNDIDPELTTFLRVLRDQPQELIQSFDWALVSRAEFQRLAATDPTTLTDTERAHRFYYVTMASWGGESAYPRFQTSTNDKGYGNRLIGALQHLHERLIPTHQRLKGVEIENRDWKECLALHDHQDTVLYLDPPYLGNGVNYRFNMRSNEEHLEMARHLRHTRSSWILSAYDNHDTRRIFKDFPMTQISSASGMAAAKAPGCTTKGRTINRELIITNFSPQRQQLF